MWAAPALVYMSNQQLKSISKLQFERVSGMSYLAESHHFQRSILKIKRNRNQKHTSAVFSCILPSLLGWAGVLTGCGVPGEGVAFRTPCDKLNDSTGAPVTCIFVIWNLKCLSTSRVPVDQRFPAIIQPHAILQPTAWCLAQEYCIQINYWLFTNQQRLACQFTLSLHCLRPRVLKLQMNAGYQVGYSL